MPDNVTFMTIPTDWRVPGQYVEVDNSRAVRGLPNPGHKILLIGQRLATGSVAQQVLTRVTRPQDGVDYFGRGSQLAQMVAASLKVNPYTETWALALDDLLAGVKATSTIAVTGPATSAGTLYLYIGGIRVPFAVAVGDTATVVAAAIAAAITANPDLAVTAAAAAGVVTLTAKHKGIEGNNIDVRIGYYQGELTTITGLTFAFAAGTAGSGNPDVTNAIAAMSTGAFYTIVMAWTDTANLALMENELRGRWGGMSMRAGHVFTMLSGTYSAVDAIGSARNSPHSTLFALKKCPTLPWVVAAQAAAGVEFSGGNDPAIPFHGIFLPDCLPPVEADRYLDTEKNTLLHDGISTFYVGDDGGLYIEQVVTTYQTDSFGLDDVSLLKLNTKWTADYARSVCRIEVARAFPAHKLAGDDVLKFISPGQKIATPKLIENVLIGAANKLVRAGIIEDIEQFKRDLLVLRSTADVNRVNSIIPPNLVNQFDVFAASIQYIL